MYTLKLVLNKTPPDIPSWIIATRHGFFELASYHRSYSSIRELLLSYLGDEKQGLSYFLAAGVPTQVLNGLVKELADERLQLHCSVYGSSKSGASCIERAKMSYYQFSSFLTASQGAVKCNGHRVEQA